MRRRPSNRPNHVVVGQVWNLLLGHMEACRFTLISVDGNKVTGHTDNGRVFSLNKSVFVRGLRSARLMVDADGTVVEYRRPYTAQMLNKLEDSRTASELRTSHGPRGITCANPRRLAAFEMRESGKTCHEIAEHFGVSDKCAETWVRLEKERRRDLAMARAS